MNKIATTNELALELRRLLKYARTSLPSRARLARALRDLSIRVAAKNPEDMSAGEINKALDALDKKRSKVNDELIEAGRGNETSDETSRLHDPLAKRFNELRDQHDALHAEIKRRYGPGAPHRLPTGKGFGPLRKSAAKKPKNPTVVIAWVVEELVHDGKPFAADLGQRPKFIPQNAAKSLVWKNNATEADFHKAVAFAKREHGDTGHVYVYDATERDPLEKARKDIVAEKPSATKLAHLAAKAPKPQFKAKDQVYVLRLIPGTSIGKGSRVEIVEVGKQRGAAPRYKVLAEDGKEAWAYEDVLSDENPL